MKNQILAVDDEQVVLDSLTLGIPEYDWTAVTRGSEALAHLQARRFDLLITDVRMPEMDGVSLLQDVRDLEVRGLISQFLAKIILTGYADEEAIQLGLSTGGAYRVAKPWGGELEVTIKRALEEASLREKYCNDTATLLEQITESESALQNVFDSIGDPMFLTDRRGLIERVNPKGCQLLEYSPAEILGRSPSLFIASPTLKEFISQAALSRIIDVPIVAQDHHTAFLTRGGTEIPASISLSFIRTPTGEVQGLVIIAKDVRDIQLEAAELRAELDRIRSTQEASYEQIRSLKHEVNALRQQAGGEPRYDVPPPPTG